MIGTTRRINPHTSTVDFVRFPSNGHRQDRESVIFSLHPILEDKRLIFQLGTSCPARAVEAAKLVAADVAGVDVNAGCPKPFSTTGGMGAALLRAPDTLCTILEALVNEVGVKFEIGISVKIRLLESPEMTGQLVRRLCATGITGLTVHCRTTPMRPREKAIRDQLRMVASICRESGVACLMNGDVEDRDAAMQLMEEYQVDGAMIATCAEANPTCFRTKAKGGLAPWKTVAAEYFRTALTVDNKLGNTKFLLGQLIPGKESVYKAIATSYTYENICQVLDLGELRDLAVEVDERLGNYCYPDRESMKEARKHEMAAAVGGTKKRNTVSILPEKGQSIRERGIIAERGLALDV